MPLSPQAIIEIDQACAGASATGRRLPDSCWTRARARWKALELADWMRAPREARDEICIPCRARTSMHTDFSWTFLFRNFVPV